MAEAYGSKLISSRVNKRNRHVAFNKDMAEVGMLSESANEGRDRKKGRKHNSSGFPDSVTIIIAAKDH